MQPGLGVTGWCMQPGLLVTVWGMHSQQPGVQAGLLVIGLFRCSSGCW
jgi:hypothetical protein